MPPTLPLNSLAMAAFMGASLNTAKCSHLTHGHILPTSRRRWGSHDVHRERSLREGHLLIYPGGALPCSQLHGPLWTRLNFNLRRHQKPQHPVVVKVSPWCDRLPLSPPASLVGREVVNHLPLFTIRPLLCINWTGIGLATTCDQ